VDGFAQKTIVCRPSVVVVRVSRQVQNETPATRIAPSETATHNGIWPRLGRAARRRINDLSPDDAGKKRPAQRFGCARPDYIEIHGGTSGSAPAANTPNRLSQGCPIR
jgi:hypothetical protein